MYGGVEILLTTFRKDCHQVKIEQTDRDGKYSNSNVNVDRFQI